jgi:predicted dehydrogenase
MAKLGVGIIGLDIHYHAYPLGEYLRDGVADAHLVAVSDLDAQRAHEFAKAYNATASYTDHRDLLNRDDVDAVVVTSYTAAHATHCIDAAAAGKHIMVDKPIATTLSDADRIIDAAKGAGVYLMTAYPLRFAPPYAKAKRWIEAGKIGEPVSGAYSMRIPLPLMRGTPDADDPGWFIDPEKSGGGGFLDHCIHYADLLRWLFNSEAVSVMGKVGRLTTKDLPVDDYGVAIVTFESGAIVTIESSWHGAKWYGRSATSPDTCFISGTEGEIFIRYRKTPQVELYGGDQPYEGSNFWDYEGEGRYDTGYRRLLQSFVQSVQNDTPPPVTGEDGRKALEISLAGYMSSRDGKEIELPMPTSFRWTPDVFGSD